MTNNEVIKLDKIDFKPRKRNVCAYARVSSSTDLQELSFDVQVRTYTDYILNNKDWNFAGVYADEGKSGTNFEKRSQFVLMIEAAKNGLIDMIITKSISRFARNTVDCLSTIQNLTRCGTEVWFESQNISSFDPKIEFVISIMSGMAEEESRSISENVKWGYKKRFEKGQFYLDNQGFLGYDRDNDGNLIINEDEALTVKKIYELFLSGLGAEPIMKYLEENNIKTSQGNLKWNKSAIYGILKNEKYTGNAILQKTLRTSFKSKKKTFNDGILPKYLVMESHPVIISQEVFDEVQLLRKEKSLKYHKSDIKDMKETFGKGSPYTSIFRCIHCGNHFHVRVNKIGSDFASKFLQCYSNHSRKNCKAETLSCYTVDQEIVNQINLIIKNKTTFLKYLKTYLENDERVINAENELRETQAKLSVLEERLNEAGNISNDFYKAIVSELKEQLIPLNFKIIDLKNKLLTELNSDIIYNKIKNTLIEYKDQVHKIEDFPYQSFFSKIIVVDRNNLLFIVGSRQDFENIDINKDKFFEGSVEYKIRKTAFESNHGVLFF